MGLYPEGQQASSEFYNEAFLDLGVTDFEALLIIHAFSEIAHLLLLAASSEEVSDPFRGMDPQDVLASVQEFIDQLSD